MFVETSTNRLEVRYRMLFVKKDNARSYEVQRHHLVPKFVRYRRE